jgi:hypothetical protein
MLLKRVYKPIIMLIGTLIWNNAFADLCEDLVAGVNAGKADFESVKGVKRIDPDIGVLYSTSFQSSAIENASCHIQEDEERSDQVDLICALTNSRGTDSETTCRLYSLLENEFKSCLRQKYPSSQIYPMSNSSPKNEFKSLRARALAKSNKGFQVEAALSKNVFRFQSGRKSCQVSMSFSLK